MPNRKEVAWGWNTSRTGNGSFLSTRSDIPHPRKQRGRSKNPRDSVEGAGEEGAKVVEQEVPPELPPPTNSDLCSRESSGIRTITGKT